MNWNPFLPLGNKNIAEKVNYPLQTSFHLNQIEDSADKGNWMKQEVTGRNKKKLEEKNTEAGRNWMILKETGRNRNKPKETERNRKKQEERGRKHKKQ